MLLRDIPKKHRPDVVRVSNQFLVHVSDLLGPTRGSPRVALARQHLMKAFFMKGMNYTKIGGLLERDRTTVSHGVRIASQ